MSNPIPIKKMSSLMKSSSIDYGSKTDSPSTTFTTNPPLPKSASTNHLPPPPPPPPRSVSLPHTSSSILRPLDPTEVFWNSFHSVGNVMILSVISVVSSHPINILQLEEASTILTNRHQVLRCRIVPPSVAHQHNASQDRNQPSSKKAFWRRTKSSGAVISSNGLAVCSNDEEEAVSAAVIKEEELTLNDCYWDACDTMKPDVLMARVSTGVSAGGVASCLDWLEAMAREQKKTFNLTEGPLWRLRMMPGTACLSFGEFGLQGSAGCELDETCSQTRYRTYIMGAFHHSIMDGVSRQRFWNELCCSLSIVCKRDLVFSKCNISNKVHHHHNCDCVSSVLPAAVSFAEERLVVTSAGPVLPQTRFPDPVQTSVPSNWVMTCLNPLFSPLSKPASFVVNGQRKLMSALRNPFSYSYPKRFRDPVVTSHTSIIPLWIPADVTSKLQKMAKSSKVTVNGVITAVAGLAMARLIWQRRAVIKRLEDNNKYKTRIVLPQANSVISVTDTCATSPPLSTPNASPTATDVRGTSHHHHHQTSSALDISPFIAHNPNDKDSFPLPVHTPHYVVTKNYKPWDAALRASRHPSSSHFNVTPNKQSTLSHRLSRVRDKLRRETTGGSSRKAWWLPLHINTMQAISCRRWLHTYCVKTANQDTESFLEYLQHRYTDAIRELYSYVETQKAVTNGPVVHRQDLSNLSIVHRFDSVSTEASSHAVTEDDSDVAVITDTAEALSLSKCPPPAAVCNQQQLVATVMCATTATTATITSTPSPTETEQKPNTTIDCLPPGLGSYAILMPHSVWVSRNCEIDKQFWNFAKNSARKVHRLVDQKTPTSATLNWQIMSGFIRAASSSRKTLKRLASPTPRPSSYMISNGGKWDETVVDRMLDSLNSGPSDTNAPDDASSKFYVKVESSWSCVAQHQAGVNMFCHNVVTLGGRMCWSLQYHTNLTNKSLATEYGRQILQIINELVK
eukprot:GHVQ01006965.1.p1 GENE.GHVQ01006965.1~~GHVQ01006965.1.p1  ORF type:complete len:964 (-),score=170.39 GHVQ01006965.1:709-3600(-)